MEKSIVIDSNLFANVKNAKQFKRAEKFFWDNYPDILFTLGVKDMESLSNTYDLMASKYKGKKKIPKKKLLRKLKKGIKALDMIKELDLAYLHIDMAFSYAKKVYEEIERL